MFSLLSLSIDYSLVKNKATAPAFNIEVEAVLSTTDARSTTDVELDAAVTAWAGALDRSGAAFEDKVPALKLAIEDKRVHPHPCFSRTLCVTVYST